MLTFVDVAGGNGFKLIVSVAPVVSDSKKDPGCKAINVSPAGLPATELKTAWLNLISDE
jgi:hypothetical protein